MLRLSCLAQGCTARASVIRAEQWDPAHRTKALPSNLCYSGTEKHPLWTDSGLIFWAECPAGFGAMRYFPAVCCLGFLAKGSAVDMLWQPHFTYFSLYWGAMKKLISKASPCQNYIITVSVVSRPSGANLILCWSSINTYHIIALWCYENFNDGVRKQFPFSCFYTSTFHSSYLYAFLKGKLPFQIQIAQ